jgi:hypothetical protein
MPAMRFDNHVRAIVDDFLQTVVVVDDEALPLRGDHTDDPGHNSPQAAPGGLAIEAVKPPTGKRTDGHELNAKDVIDAFALHGLVCSILDPDSAVEERLTNTAARADLLVMDWWIDGDRGGRATELIEAVLKADEAKENRRLRVIAIYTGQDDLQSVANELEKMLKGFYANLPFDREPETLSMTKGPVRMTVLAKEYVKMTVPGQEANQVKVADLPDRLALEFAQLARGLVSSVALHGLAALRRVRPIDAEDHLRGLVAAEFGSVLADAEIGAKGNIEAIQLWLKAVADEGLSLGSLFSFSPKLSEQQIVTMLKDGLGDEELFSRYRQGTAGRSNTQLKKILRSATDLFSADAPEAEDSTGAFASRMMLRTVYRKPRRELRLGTVIYRYGKFAICVQPVCDSVRLQADADTAFPFLSLEIQESGRTDLMVPHPLRQNEWVRLKLGGKPQNMRMITFRAGVAGVVPAYKDGSSYRFNAIGGRYRWVADLKPEFAQRLAHEVGQQFSRVGLDEPELLRLTR